MSLDTLRRRLLPRGPLDLVVQFAVIAAAYTAWRYLRGAVAPSDLSAAFASGRDLVSFQDSIGTLIEADVQSWAQDNEWAGEVARWGYANLHFKGSVLALLVVFLFYRGSYGFLRNTVIAAMAISVLSYWLYPVAPPRFLPELGLDGSTAVTGNNTLLSDPDNPLFNPVAAVPSMHVGLATIFSWTLAFLVPWRPLKAALFAYPLLMTYVVVASGNHYWIDALFGVMTAAAAWGIATLLGRANPDWAFGGDPGGPAKGEAAERTAVTA